MSRLTIGKMMFLVVVFGLNAALVRLLMDAARDGNEYLLLVLIGLLPILNLLGAATALVASRYRVSLEMGASRDPTLAFLVWCVPVLSAAFVIAIISEEFIYFNAAPALWSVVEPAFGSPGPESVWENPIIMYLAVPTLFMVLLAGPVLAILCLLVALTSQYRIRVRRRVSTPAI